MKPTPQRLTASKSGPFKGHIQVPGDKSISHRALLFGALATGKTVIRGLLEGEDVLATAKALEQLGIPVKKTGECWEVLGRGLGGMTKPGTALDFGNSGTGVRLMMGVLAGQDFDVRLTGDESLTSRPMARVLNPLRQMGLNITEGKDDRLPLTLHGTTDLLPIEYDLPVASAQVKSAILLAALHAPGSTTIGEPKPTRDHTERMLRHFGAQLTIEDVGQETKMGRKITITGEPALTGQNVTVPGDPSSAAFLIAAALISPSSDIKIDNVLINPTRTGLFETLIEMGANIRFENERSEGGEPVADIHVIAGPLKGITVPASRAPRMIDEYPILAAIAAFAEGETRMEGLEELRVKESDRLSAMQAGLHACGVIAEIDGDTLIVQGSENVPGGGLIETHMDHRIAMSFLILGLGTQKPVTIDDASMINTSFPTFTDLMTQIGATITQNQGNEH